MRPVLARSVLLSASDEHDGYDAFDTSSTRLHRLNATAALILELCDGSRTLDDLRDELLPIAGETGWAQCSAWIEQAIADGLLEVDGLAEARGRRREALDNTEGNAKALPYSAGDYSELARELRRNDRILEAFMCQERATELDPDNPDLAYGLGELAHILGRRDIACAAYERYLAERQDDVEIAHILTALRDEPPPPRASSSFIQQLYARFAESYDASMTSDLEYQAPALLDGAVGRATGRHDLEILDLGCGTGLSGQSLRPRARRMVGIDLSPDMIERAGHRGVYDALHVAEITDWLTSGTDRHPFDLIVSCDALIYFGDLRQVLVPAAALLNQEGLVAFTVERGDISPFKLTDSGRFAHNAHHIEEAADAAGLSVVSLEEAVLRYEYGAEVTGIVTVLKLKLKSESSKS